MNKVKWTKEILDEIFLLRESYTLKEIGDMYHATPGSIRRALHWHNYPSVFKRAKPIKNIADADLCYMAGLLDGEGHIDIRRKHIIIVNTNHDVIIWLVNNFGGSVVMVIGHGNHHTLWRWKLSTCYCRFLLRKLLPYLIIKKNQALVFLDTV